MRVMITVPTQTLMAIVSQARELGHWSQAMTEK